MTLHRLAPAVLAPAVLALALALALPGCALFETAPAAAPQAEAAPGDATRPRARPEGQAARIAPAGARSAEAFDTTTEDERAAAVAAAPAGGQELGRVVASLGNPAEPGFWLRSALVGTARPGTVRLASGATAQVELRPAAGGGPQLSLAAYRALGLPLTALPELTVLAR